MIRSLRVIPEFLRKSACRMWISITLCKKGPAIGGAFLANMTIAGGQWPKNNHNRIITGIGTPSSQSKIPRPIIISSINFS
jgi:hypothetical protein